VHFVNEVNDPERYLAAADIFCLPSHREGFGLSVIEAAACELPAVVTDIYGLTDAVQEGITGLRVPPSDPVALSGALCRLLEDSDLRSRMGAAGRRRTIEQFGSSTLTDALLRLVLHLAKKSATSRFPT
jgi:glycosyltransferase involved in cell wall biosynthesis